MCKKEKKKLRNRETAFLFSERYAFKSKNEFGDL